MNDDELARLLRQETAKLRLARLEKLVVAGLGLDDGDWAFFKAIPVAGEVTDTLALPLDVKAADDTTGDISGYLSTFDLDLGKDIVLRGAYAKTIADAQRFAKMHRSASLWPLLWQHQKDEPIGGIYEAHEDAVGLSIAARLNLSIEKGRQAYDGLKQGYLSFSIGYTPVKYQWKGNIRQLTEIKLGEGSVVTFPMNREARATGVA
jgi:Escherichia/Staphylococcus phage prohead protease